MGYNLAQNTFLNFAHAVTFAKQIVSALLIWQIRVIDLGTFCFSPILPFSVFFGLYSILLVCSF